MALRASFAQRVFHFDFAARTSRGAMRDKRSWFIKIWESQTPEIVGIGECGPLPGLSPEEQPDFETVLATAIGLFEKQDMLLSDFTIAGSNLTQLREAMNAKFGRDLLAKNASLAFALETALLDLGRGGSRLIFDNSFIKGQPIPINGLVWMGGLDFMLQQVEVKIRDGFKCIKLKVGGLDFEKEHDIVQYVRRKYFRDDIIVRLDANGAFKPEDTIYKLGQLSRFDVHSIEQPIKPGSKELAALCQSSPIPIALDEELIGVHERSAKESLLDTIKPAFIILKPTLHGGFFGCHEWIDLADQRGIGWWITSALESNIGLNAICQFTANFDIKIHQGLGTGSIYSDNIDSPLEVKKGFLSFNSKKSWDQENI